MRADSPGFVAEILVRGGQQVTEGQTLVVLRNDDLSLELADLEYAIEQTETKCRVYEHGRQLAASQAEAKQLEALRTKYEEKSRQVANLTLRAPVSGHVIGVNLENLSGVYVKPGEEVLSIGNEQHKELQLAIAQEKLSVFELNVGRPLSIRLRGGGALRTTLTSITPRASRACPHPAPSGVNGGPLPVRAGAPDPHDGNAVEPELLVPHFTGKVKLDSELSSQLRAGQIGRAALPLHREAIGRYVHRTLSQLAPAAVSSGEFPTPKLSVGVYTTRPSPIMWLRHPAAVQLVDGLNWRSANPVLTGRDLISTLCGKMPQSRRARLQSCGCGILPQCSWLTASIGGARIPF